MEVQPPPHNPGNQQVRFHLLNQDVDPCDQDGEPEVAQRQPVRPLEEGDQNGWNGGDGRPDVRDKLQHARQKTQSGGIGQPDGRVDHRRDDGDKQPQNQLPPQESIPDFGNLVAQPNQVLPERPGGQIVQPGHNAIGVPGQVEG